MTANDNTLNDNTLPGNVVDTVDDNAEVYVFDFGTRHIGKPVTAVDTGFLQWCLWQHWVTTPEKERPMKAIIAELFRRGFLSTEDDGDVETFYYTIVARAYYERLREARVELAAIWTRKCKRPGENICC